MNVRLWLRMAFAGGRQSLARVGLVAGGVAVGVVLLLVALTAAPALQGRIDRYAWHRTEASAPATARDSALWLPVTDRYAGQNVVRIHIAPLGPNPPLPPGVDRLPAPGEVLVSPALAQLLAAAPDDQLDDRFPGLVTGTIGPDGLVSPDELIAIIGHTPDELRGTPQSFSIAGFEAPGEEVDLGVFVQILVGLLAVLLLGPLAVFIVLVTRVDAARREQRLAAIRLAGATRWQTARLAATETAVSSTAGVLLGWLGYQVVRPLIARSVRLEGIRFPLSDLAVPTAQVVVVLVAVPLAAVVATLVALQRVQVTPLGVQRRVRRRPPRAWRLAPIAAGIAGIVEVDRRSRDSNLEEGPLLSLVAMASLLSIVVGIVITGPWVCMWISRGIARLSRQATTLMAARRIAANPYAASHSVIAVALAAFAAAPIAIAGSPAPPTGVALAPGVVSIQVRGAQDEAVASLITDDTVVARAGTQRSLVVACADLARVTTVSCPYPAEWDEEPVAALFRPSNLVEPGPNDDPDAESLPINTILVPTDGTPAAEERLRTRAAATMPHALTRSARDYSPGAQPIDAELFEAAFSGTSSLFPAALVFVLLVAACSLTVSTVAALMERRRPFALLRASGVDLWQLRRLALLETAVPLVVTVLGGVGIVLVLAYLAGPEDFTWPPPSFFVGLGVALAVTIAVSMLTWPLLNATTRHDNVRFE